LISWSHISPVGAFDLGVANWGLMNPGIPANFAPSVGIPKDFARFTTDAAQLRSEESDGGQVVKPSHER
jgi:hypothetical protein